MGSYPPKHVPNMRRMRNRAPAGNNRLGCAKPKCCPIPHTKHAAASLLVLLIQEPRWSLERASAQPQGLPVGVGACFGNNAAASSPRCILPSKTHGRHVHVPDHHFETQTCHRIAGHYTARRQPATTG